VSPDDAGLISATSSICPRQARGFRKADCSRAPKRPHGATMVLPGLALAGRTRIIFFHVLRAAVAARQWRGHGPLPFHPKPLHDKDFSMKRIMIAAVALTALMWPAVGPSTVKAQMVSGLDNADIDFEYVPSTRFR